MLPWKTKKNIDAPDAQDTPGARVTPDAPDAPLTLLPGWIDINIRQALFAFLVANKRLYKPLCP